MIAEALRPAIAGFQFAGEAVEAQELRSGHVNRTYLITCERPRARYILQKINRYAFRQPQLLMENVRRITAHLREKIRAAGGACDRRVLEFIPAANGELLFEDGAGEFWRAYRYVDDAFAYDRVERREDFYQAGRAFGEFQRLLADFPIGELHETIAHFHDTPRRFEDFVRAVERDAAGRADGVREQIDFFYQRRQIMGEIVRRLETGELPLRVTHNDTKINNVLIDAGTRQAICVIDLDTVMPGSALYDFGDAVRFGATTAAEDERDLSKMRLDMDLFIAFTEGFLREAGAILTAQEKRLLPLGAQVITLEIAMRFLADYLEGDPYFKIDYPEHNLVRACAQMQLLRDMERNVDQMNHVVARLASAPA